MIVFDGRRSDVICEYQLRRLREADAKNEVSRGHGLHFTLAAAVRDHSAPLSDRRGRSAGDRLGANASDSLFAAVVQSERSCGRGSAVIGGSVRHRLDAALRWHRLGS